MKNAIIILAIESSCDDTAASIIKNGAVISNVTNSQTIHKLYGGVVPEVASRMHQESIIPVVDAAIKKANILKSELSAVAVTRGPGLMGSLMVGLGFAKSMALSLDIPIIAVNHLQAHILAHFAENPKPQFPFLCLTVSGGHTQIVKVTDYHSMELLGQTLDDAAGEAFDKSGKLLGLDYPAGPIIDKLAQEGNPVFEFPEPRIKDLDFSFSGLKTSIMYFVKRNTKKDPDFIKKNINDICCSIQDRIVSILMNKLQKAAKSTGIQQVAIAGGVSANSKLRDELTRIGKVNGWSTFIPQFEYCTDNAAMIGISGYYKFLNKEFADQNIKPVPRMKF